MKSKLLLAAALCAMAFSANAQTEKGKSLINGSVGFGSNKTDDISTGLSTSKRKSSYSTIAPNYGYFISNNLAIGLGVGYLQNKETVNSTDIISSTPVSRSQILKQRTFRINPFLRKYTDIAEKFKFFGHLTAGVGFGNIEVKNEFNYTSPTLTTESRSKISSYYASLSPGFAFYPSKKWGIEFSFPLIAYNKSEPKDETQNITLSNTESFDFATDSFNPNIGFTFHF